MKKIYSLGVNPTEWFNFSNHLNILHEKIRAYQEYLNFFQPDYKILNESMTVCDANTLVEENTIIDAEERNPEWEYEITWLDPVDNSNKSRTVYCYFPSNLKLNEGYLNTHYESYLVFEAPPNAYTPTTEKTKITITETEWEEKIAKGTVRSFPISCVVMSKQWHQQGIQSNRNSSGFNPDNYLIISKPSASWYVPTSGLHSLSFKFYDNAMENIGSIIPLQFEMIPARYSFYKITEQLNDDDIKQTWHEWSEGHKAMSFQAASWNSTTATTPSAIQIANADGGQWTNTYPLMHKLEFWDENEQCEDLICDDIFQNINVNIKDHLVSAYTVTITSVEDIDSEITDLWGQHVKVILC